MDSAFKIGNLNTEIGTTMYQPPPYDWWEPFARGYRAFVHAQGEDRRVKTEDLTKLVNDLGEESYIQKLESSVVRGLERILPTQIKDRVIDFNEFAKLDNSRKLGENPPRLSMPAGYGIPALSLKDPEDRVTPETLASVLMFKTDSAPGLSLKKDFAQGRAFKEAQPSLFNKIIHKQLSKFGAVSVFNDTIMDNQTRFDAEIAGNIPGYYPPQASMNIIKNDAHHTFFADKFGNSNLVCLAVGTGRKETTLQNILTRLGRGFKSIYLNDLVKDNLPIASARFMRVGIAEENIHIRRADIFDENFWKLSFWDELKNSPDRTIITLFGATIGNFIPDEVDFLLGKLKEKLKPGDKVVIDVDSTQDRKTIKKAYGHPVFSIFFLFHYMYVRRMEWLRFNDNEEAQFKLAEAGEFNPFEHVGFEKRYDENGVSMIVTDEVDIPDPSSPSGLSHKKIEFGAAIMRKHSIEYWCETFGKHFKVEAILPAKLTKQKFSKVNYNHFVLAA